jgi:type I restriction enzyme S subunit
MKAGWEKRKLREVCELVNGRAYSKPELLPEGKYPVLRVGNFFTSDHWYYSDLELEDKKYCDFGDLLYAWSASFGPRVWTGGKVIFHYHIWKVIPDAELIDQKFLFHFFQWDVDQIKQDSGAGTTMLHVSKGSMEDRDILLPPLPEQQRIVAILDEAVAGISKARAAAEQNRQNARALFESHLQSVFSHRGEGWIDTTIGAVIKFIDYRGKTPVKTESGVRLITAKNVKMGYLQETPAEFIAAEGYASWMTRGIPKKGDVLFTTEAPLANVAQLDTDEKVAFAQRIIIMQPNPESLDSAFLKYLLLSQPVQQRIRTKGTGATVQGIKASLLKLIEISFPESLATQEQIVRDLDSLQEETQRLESIYQRKLEALDELKQSLLHQAFSGNL